MRICRKCLTNRCIDDFPVVKKVSDTKIYYRHTCKLCQKQYADKYNVNYYIINSDKLIEANKKNYQKNKKNDIYIEKRKIYAKNYSEINKPKLRIKAKNDSANRRKSKIYVLRSNISRTIREALARRGSGKNGQSVLQLLNYSIKQLKIHLESLFEPWMTWENYGPYVKTWNDDDQSTWSWNIDHIIPQSLLQYDTMNHPNFHKSWALNNLRPYSSKQNLRDGNRRKVEKCLSI